MNRTIIKKMLNAKKALNHTLDRILDINRKRKELIDLEKERYRRQARQEEEELRMLNKMAAHHARIVQHYENMLDRRG